MTDAIEAVGVVIPARDEERLIGACLRAVATAASQVDVPVLTLVVDDGSRDGTVAIAREHGAVVVRVEPSGVGAARAAGARHVLDLAADPCKLWLASTDADSQVPSDWLQVQLALAAAGTDVVVGSIRLSGEDERLHQAWASDYRGLTDGPVEGHGHVHGANLGVRASSYVEVGGFLPLLVHEDADLVARLTQLGSRVVRTLAAPVTTSARLRGRAAGGVADDLRLAAGDVAG